MSAQIFIDAENIQPEICFKTVKKFRREYKIDRVDIFGKEDVMSRQYLNVGGIFHFNNCFYGKNSADTWLCTAIIKTIFEKSYVDVIILISNDRDFLPAIKFANEHNRRVIFVSNGVGHKNLYNLFHELDINFDLIELIDYRVELDDDPEDFAEFNSLNFSEKIEKLAKIFPEMSPGIANYFLKRKKSLRFIFIRKKNKFIEIPFIDGIGASTFMNILLDMKIIENDSTAEKVAAENFLKFENNRIYLYNEEEIMDKNFYDSKNFKNIPEIANNYFEKNRAKVKKIFFKRSGDLIEIPFVNGIPTNIFSTLLHSMGLTRRGEKFKTAIEKNLLKIVNNGVYLLSEEEILEIEEKNNSPKKFIEVDMDLLSDAPKKFLMKHFDEIKFIAFKNSIGSAKVPFIDGIHISIFIQILHELKILGRNSPSTKILNLNGFTIKNNRVYRE